MARSLAKTQPGQNGFERDALSAIALCDRLEEHALGFGIRLEGFFVREENCDRRPLRKLGVG